MQVDEELSVFHSPKSKEQTEDQDKREEEESVPEDQIIYKTFDFAPIKPI